MLLTTYNGNVNTEIHTTITATGIRILHILQCLRAFQSVNCMA